METWTRQAGESSKAYAAFCTYRDLGPERSLDKALAAANKKPTNRRHWARWMDRFSWYARAQAYDDYIEQERRRAQEKEIMEMADRHARIATNFQTAVIQRLTKLEPEELSPSDMAKWFDIAVKVERLSRGEATESVKQEVGGQVNIGGDLTERIERYADIYRQAARRSTLCSGNEGDDTREPLDTARPD